MEGKGELGWVDHITNERNNKVDLIITGGIWLRAGFNHGYK